MIMENEQITLDERLDYLLKRDHFGDTVFTNVDVLVTSAILDDVRDIYSRQREIDDIRESVASFGGDIEPYERMTAELDERVDLLAKGVVRAEISNVVLDQHSISEMHERLGDKRFNVICDAMHEALAEGLSDDVTVTMLYDVEQHRHITADVADDVAVQPVVDDVWEQGREQVVTPRPRETQAVDLSLSASADWEPEVQPDFNSPEFGEEWDSERVLPGVGSLLSEDEKRAAQDLGLARSIARPDVPGVTRLDDHVAALFKQHGRNLDGTKIESKSKDQDGPSFS